MALTDSTLTTLQSVKDELSISVSTHDSYLERLIESASSFVSRYCGRTFERADDISEKLAGYGGTILAVSRTPLLALASVSYDGTALDSDTYETHDLDAGEIYGITPWEWTAKAKNNIAEDDKMPGTERKLYTVVYDGGYVTPSQVANGSFVTRTLPYDIEDAVIKLVTSRYLKRGADSSVKAEKLQSYSVQYLEDNAMLPEVEVMNRYRVIF